MWEKVMTSEVFLILTTRGSWKVRGLRVKNKSWGSETYQEITLKKELCKVSFELCHIPWPTNFSAAPHIKNGCYEGYLGKRWNESNKAVYSFDSWKVVYMKHDISKSLKRNFSLRFKYSNDLKFCHFSGMMVTFEKMLSWMRRECSFFFTVDHLRNQVKKQSSHIHDDIIITYYHTGEVTKLYTYTVTVHLRPGKSIYPLSANSHMWHRHSSRINEKKNNFGL